MDYRSMDSSVIQVESERILIQKSLCKAYKSLMRHHSEPGCCSLPNEILFMIFRFAVDDTSNRFPQVNYASRLTCLQSFSLVNKQWCPVALALMYEDVRLSNYRNLFAIFRNSIVHRFCIRSLSIAGSGTWVHVEVLRDISAANWRALRELEVDNQSADGDFACQTFFALSTIRRLLRFKYICSASCNEFVSLCSFLLCQVELVDLTILNLHWTTLSDDFLLVCRPSYFLQKLRIGFSEKAGGCGLIVHAWLVGLSASGPFPDLWSRLLRIRHLEHKPQTLKILSLENSFVLRPLAWGLDIIEDFEVTVTADLRAMVHLRVYLDLMPKLKILRLRIEAKQSFKTILWCFLSRHADLDHIPNHLEHLYIESWSDDGSIPPDKVFLEEGNGCFDILKETVEEGSFKRLKNITLTSRSNATPLTKPDPFDIEETCQRKGVVLVYDY